MMPLYYYDKAGTPIPISSHPITTAGGEGSIYDLLGPMDIPMVAKIYHTTQMAQKRQAKLEFMIGNNPTKNTPKEVQEAVVWPINTLYNQEGIFVGFTMPKVNETIGLKALTLPKNPSKTQGAQWHIFDHNELASHQKRLVVAYNLAQAIHSIHQSGNYVIVDLKPENVFVKTDGSIAIIDLDSIQINNPNVHFPAKVYTEEFAPPEKHKGIVNHQSGSIGVEWDYFSLAVILYELFLGIHPFQASHKILTTRPEMIERGLFVFGQKADQLYVIPNIHNNFKRLHIDLQKTERHWQKMLSMS